MLCKHIDCYSQLESKLKKSPTLIVVTEHGSIISNTHSHTNIYIAIYALRVNIMYVHITKQTYTVAICTVFESVYCMGSFPQTNTLDIKVLFLLVCMLPTFEGRQQFHYIHFY